MPDLPLTTLSFAYPAVSLEDRAIAQRALGDPAEMSSALASMGHEAFVLTTCLRLDVMVPGSAEEFESVISVIFGRDMPGGGQRRSGTDALTYLYRVAAGLESPIKGEDDVLVQFRQALDEAKITGAVRSPLVIKGLEGAVAAGRQARGMMTGAGHRTLASIAAERVGAASSVAVFGAGVMGRAVVESLDASEVTVVVRRPEQVVVPGSRVVGMEQATGLLASVDAVVVATAARGRLLEEDAFSAALAQRTSRLTLVDLAVPRDLVPPPGADVDYIDVDGLSMSVDGHQDIAKAEALVEEAARRAADRIRSHDLVGPAIASLLERGEGAAAEVAARFGGRFDEDQRALVEQMARAVARKVLHEPVAYLRRDRRSGEELEVLLEAFDVG